MKSWEWKWKIKKWEQQNNNIHCDELQEVDADDDYMSWKWMVADDERSLQVSSRSAVLLIKKFFCFIHLILFFCLLESIQFLLIKFLRMISRLSATSKFKVISIIVIANHLLSLTKVGPGAPRTFRTLSFISISIPYCYGPVCFSHLNKQ